MSTPQAFYTIKLYPLQNGILEIVTNLNTPFYLSGGTALGRCYFRHRYSDDLDFFVNGDPEYVRHVGLIFRELRARQTEYAFAFHADTVISETYFSQVVVSRQTEGETCELKIDLINDVSEHFGDIKVFETFGRVDQKGERALFMIITDKTWIPNTIDTRRLGVRILAPG